MTSDRPYRKALSVHQAIQILLEGRGTQWEPAIVNAFLDMIVRQMDQESNEDRSAQQASSLSQTALVAS
jgi:HD-GYP domain-containing protein (c-di-GMP phosphodiesterase class II)